MSFNELQKSEQVGTEQTSIPVPVPRFLFNVATELMTFEKASRLKVSNKQLAHLSYKAIAKEQGLVAKEIIIGLSSPLAPSTFVVIAAILAEATQSIDISIHDHVFNAKSLRKRLGYKSSGNAADLIEQALIELANTEIEVHAVTENGEKHLIESEKILPYVSTGRLTLDKGVISISNEYRHQEWFLELHWLLIDFIADIKEPNISYKLIDLNTIITHRRSSRACFISIISFFISKRKSVSKVIRVSIKINDLLKPTTKKRVSLVRHKSEVCNALKASFKRLLACKKVLQHGRSLTHKLQASYDFEFLTPSLANQIKYI